MAKKTTANKTTEKSEKTKKKAVKKPVLKKTSGKKTKKPTKSFVKKALFLFSLALAAALACYILYCILTMPNIEKAMLRTRQPMTTIIAENGNDITTVGNIYSDVVMLYDVHPYVINAILATEDRRFYSHFGFDPIAFARAMSVNILSGKYAQGGSTITQQVAKNLFLTQNKTIKRKIQELFLAFWLEYKFSKDQILTLYINRVYLGAGTYGIQSASRRYFQKPASDLNLKEAAILAGILKAPSKYNPLANQANADERAKIVLQNMVNNNFIDEDQYKYALTLDTGSGEQSRVKGAKHFADWVYQETNALLGERENDILVYTTLDQHLQEKAQNILETKIAQNSDKNVNEGAIVVLDNNTGAVKAMVGGIDYGSSQFNRATQALRQPGSAFKTFVYLTALQNGFNITDKIEDYPITIGKWTPENITGKYYGTVTLKQAFANSYNLAAVDLSQRLSLDKIIKTARSLGITTPMKKNPSIVLGTAEVKVIDMAAAYAAIANNGNLVIPYAITEVYTKDGYQIYQHSLQQEKKVAKRKAVEEMIRLLEIAVRSGTGQKAKLETFSAGKTGTSQGYRDAWFVGFTDKYTIAVWVGNDDNSPMNKISGSGLPAEIWKEVAKSIK
ncbi:MAG: PBP1A family penicillin-binding protein [Lactobacillaceae bacterium]|jgi:penicillin-binding protein 1A|nr:PBP1A family penicillin-binding protein [Lactobacillaceae bacterium]